MAEVFRLLWAQVYNAGRRLPMKIVEVKEYDRRSSLTPSSKNQSVLHRIQGSCQLSSGGFGNISENHSTNLFSHMLQAFHCGHFYGNICFLLYNSLYTYNYLFITNVCTDVPDISQYVLIYRLYLEYGPNT